MLSRSCCYVITVTDILFIDSWHGHGRSSGYVVLLDGFQFPIDFFYYNIFLAVPIRK